MSSVPHVASSSEVPSVQVFGCPSSSPPVDSKFEQADLKSASKPSPRADDGVASVRQRFDASAPSGAPLACALGTGPASSPATMGLRPPVPLYHRVATVREQQGVSERTMARRLGIDIKRYRELENPTTDLTLSQLNALQNALDVPIADLLEDCHALSRPVEERAKLLKVMKTAVALREAKISSRVDRMAMMLCEQLVDLMPELAEVSGWPQFGARRGASAIGKALQHPIDTTQIGQPD